VTAFTLIAVAQAGRLSYEAVLLLASLRARSPAFPGRVIFAEPQPGPLWRDDPRIADPQVRAFLQDNGAEILPFASRHFGQSYPYGNKIEALAALPPGPFLFLDTDTLILSDLAKVPFDFARPSASMRREGTWPVIEAYGPGYATIWKSLYDRFGLDFASSLDPSQPDEYWRRYLYFNAGWFFGADPQAFGERFTKYALSIRDDRPKALVLQELNPWLDQIALPLVIHSLDGTRPGPELAGLDGDTTCHYRTLPLLYARESDAVVQALEEITAPNPVKKVLKAYAPFRRMLYQGKGAEARALFDHANLPPREQAIRNRLKAEGLWLR
jgi:hypothetical protein